MFFFPCTQRPLHRGSAITETGFPELASGDQGGEASTSVPGAVQRGHQRTANNSREVPRPWFEPVCRIHGQPVWSLPNRYQIIKTRAVRGFLFIPYLAIYDPE